MAMKGNKAGPAYAFVPAKGNKAGPAYAMTGDRQAYGGPGVIGVINTLNLDGLSSNYSDGNFGRHMQVGVIEELVDGSPGPPCLKLAIPGFWRFRWAVASGSHTIQCDVKQVINASPRPTLVVIKNTDIGINADVIVTAGSSTGWITLGPATITPNATGAVWVELHNNYASLSNTPCYFDHIVAI